MLLDPVWGMHVAFDSPLQAEHDGARYGFRRSRIASCPSCGEPEMPVVGRAPSGAHRVESPPSIEPLTSE